MQTTSMAAKEARDISTQLKGVDNPGATLDDETHVRPDLVISVQPQGAQGDVRAVLPVPTTDWRTNPRGQFIPVHGLDFLIGVSSLVIHQTVELDDLTSKIESENRYTVRVPQGEALYIASERSTASQRCLCGSGRAFVMHLHDNTRQEALQLRRRLAGASCCFPCRLQEMQVITPPGNYLGRIQQQWTFIVPFYLVRDANDDVLFVVEGPAVKPCTNVINAEFKIMSGDSLREEGKIVHAWNRELVNFTTTVHLPDRATQPKHKALLLGAAFLMTTSMAAKEARDISTQLKGVDNPGATLDDETHVRPDLVISVQPQGAQGDVRAVLPVPTTDWRTNPRGQFIPVHGLDFLIGVSSLVIHQTVELDDLTSKIESENRYTVRVPQGEALYIASERSTASQRCLCGSGRAFVMHLHDNTRQEALQLRRRLAGASCCFPCRLQEMQVITPPGNYLGRIQQQWTFIVPFYLVRDANDDVLFVVEGPAVKPCTNVINAEFKIMSGDSLREEGKIVHAWNRELVNFTTTVHLPDRATQPKHKALLLGAAFLMEYTYFERAKSRSCLRCNCL